MKKFNISKFNPCNDGKEYYESQPDFETAWNNCERGDWMLWIAKKINVDDRILTLSKAHCANTVRNLIKDKRSIKAIDAAIKYGNGEISRDELDKFAASAKDASSDAAVAAAASFSSAASASAAASYEAAYAAFSASFADSYAASAADFAAAASDADALSATAYDAAAADFARVENQKKTSDICREYLTEEVFNKIK